MSEDSLQLLKRNLEKFPDQLDEVLKLSAKVRAEGELACEEFLNPAVPEPVRLALYFLLKRILRTQRALEILVEKNMWVEAAILGLTAFEVSLDVLCICKDTGRAETWFGHKSERRHVWTMSEKLDMAFSDQGLLEHQRAVFALLSQYKHGNPVAGPHVFGMQPETSQPAPMLMGFMITCFTSHQLLLSMKEAVREVSKWHPTVNEASARLDELTEKVRFWVNYVVLVFEGLVLSAGHLSSSESRMVQKAVEFWLEDRDDPA